MLIVDLEDVAAAAGQAAVTFVIATDPEAPAGFVEGQGAPGPRHHASRTTASGSHTGAGNRATRPPIRRRTPTSESSRWPVGAERRCRGGRSNC